MGRRTDLTGKRFGKLTALEPTDRRKGGYVLWRCRCDCGNELLVSTKQLIRGAAASCGCVAREHPRPAMKAEDLTGQVFGALTVLYRTENKKGRPCWICRCECGKQAAVSSRSLKDGTATSCGCRKKQIKSRMRVDLTGRRVGRLVALYPTEKRDLRGSVVWHCRCDCGNETDVSQSELIYGNYRSCGCKKQEAKDHIQDYLTFVDGTCVEWLDSRKSRSDNTSGFRGVHAVKNGRFRVYISLMGKRYHLGYYGTYEQAVQARLDAEDQLHTGFVEQYRRWAVYAAAHPGWSEEHPFTYEVKQIHLTQFQIFCPEIPGDKKPK